MPFIEIQIIQTSELFLSQKEILKIIQQRILRTHHVEGSILQQQNQFYLRIEYPSNENMILCYQYGVPFLKKIHDIIEKYPGIPKFKTFPNNKNKEDDNNYLTLRYKTNFKSAMQKITFYAEKIAQLLHSKYVVEEIADGFIMYYGRQIDFFFQQLDRMNYEQVKKWLISRQVDITNPAIEEILDFLNQKLDFSTNSKVMNSYL